MPSPATSKHDTKSLFLSRDRHSGTYVVKFARFWITLATRVRVREVASSGYSWVRPKRLGDMMAGHKKRKKRDAEMSRWPILALPRKWHASCQAVKTSLSSAGKELQGERTEGAKKTPSLGHFVLREPKSYVGWKSTQKSQSIQLASCFWIIPNINNIHFNITQLYISPMSFNSLVKKPEAIFGQPGRVLLACFHFLIFVLYIYFY